MPKFVFNKSLILISLLLAGLVATKYAFSGNRELTNFASSSNCSDHMLNNRICSWITPTYITRDGLF